MKVCTDDDQPPSRQIEDLRLALAGAVRPEGEEGLLRDKTRPRASARVASSRVEQVVALTLKEPPAA